MQIDIENDNVVSTLHNVIQINFELDIVGSTLFNVVNSNVEIHNAVSTLIWRLSMLQCRIMVPWSYQPKDNVETNVEMFTLTHEHSHSKVSFINSFNDSNLFRDEFTLKCPRKTFLGYLLLKPLKVLKVSFAFLAILTCALCQHSNLLKTNNKFSINILVSLLLKWMPLRLQWYLGFIFEFFIKQTFLLPHSFLENCAVFAFNLCRRGKIPDFQILLLTDLQDVVSSKISCPISTAPVSCLKSLVPQCRTINSGLFDILGCMYDFMSSVAAPLNCAVVTLLFSSDKSHPITSFIIESHKVTVTGSSIFWHNFRLTVRFLVVFPVGCF